MNEFNTEYILSSWEKLHDNLKNLNEEQLEKLLAAEQKGQSRKNYLKRIHSRFAKLRNQREFKEILRGESNGKTKGRNS